MHWKMSIGKILREEREKRNLALEDISKETLIREYYLEKIENDDFGSEFDGFILSYIKKYADFLGIDSQPLLSEYKELFKKKEIVYKTKNKNIGLIVLVIVLLIIIGIALAIVQKSKNSGSSFAPKENITQTETLPQKTESPPQTNSPVQKAPSTPTTSQTENLVYPVSITLKGNGRCWLGITVDGKYTQRFINANETLELHANNYIQIRFGNAKVVSVIYNGKDLGIVSSSETVVEYKYTPNGVEKIKIP
ncbi:MAG: helix-turn-helix domain-containing protein [Caldisericum sp.]|uniref:helix-turn-helix domain-containing protein n=1 Tax=Caldisericum sp. TaxID=2499687 RepID=UPI003D14725F